MLFQSTSSDTCGVCAVSNLLSLYGIKATRGDIAALFGGQKQEFEYIVSRTMLLQAIQAYLPRASLSWKRIPRFAFTRFSGVLKEALGRGAPALAGFHVRHRLREWRGLHLAIAIHADDSGIGLIDSLGRRDGRLPNATISRIPSARGWVVNGAPLIVTSESAFVLNGLPRLSRSQLAGS
jgi:hypothetical protein